MNRIASFGLCVVLAGLFHSTGCRAEQPASPSIAPAPPPIPECPLAKDYPGFVFEGNHLQETPDITDPDLRLANAALSAHCFDWVSAFFERYHKLKPTDYHLAFLTARFYWVLDHRSMAQPIVDALLREHPDFTSARVLRASMAVEDRDYDKVKALLDQIGKEQPTDLWAYIDRLRIEATLLPSRELLATLRSIVKDERFPPNSRQQVLQTITMEMADVSQQQRDAAFADRMKGPSADSGCNLLQQAQTVIELRKDPAGGAALLEKYRGRQDTCEVGDALDTLLAEAYLWEAASQVLPDSAASRSLIAKARKLMHDDMTPLAQRIAPRPFLDFLLPELGDTVSTESADEYGRTVLCNSVMFLNVQSVADQLNRGADPMSSCEGGTLVHYLLFMATGRKNDERRGILRLLLEDGAAVEGLEFCASKDNGNCSTVLLPVLQEFDAKRRSRAQGT